MGTDPHFQGLLGQWFVQWASPTESAPAQLSSRLSESEPLHGVLGNVSVEHGISYTID